MNTAARFPPSATRLDVVRISPAAILAAALLAAPAATALAQEPDMKSAAPRSLRPPVLLPDGREFKTWQQPMTFSRTYYVAGSDPKAGDENPGTRARPFKTISRAAQVLQPGERVVVAAGVYREWVRPPRGGTGPGAMISYQAAPGANVVLKGSRIFTETWTRSTRKPAAGAADIWAAPLPEKYFGRYNPFREPNVTPEQFDIMPWAHRWRGRKPYTLPRGLVFQNGRRLAQVHTYDDLPKRKGAYWVTPKGTRLYIRPLAGSDPNRDTIEITTQGGVFAPEKMGLGYIHVKGFVVEHAAGAFSMPQYGAISACRGHHWLIENNTVRQVNGLGIDIGIQHGSLPQPKTVGHHIVRGNTICDCGVCGIAGIRPTGSLIEDNVLLRNAFHDVEQYWETGAIKVHLNENVLLRRNLIVETLHGPGIWMDFANVNSRCCGNILLGNATVHGAIFIEASAKPNLIDHNFIWQTRGAGIYEHDSRGQTFAHNFVARSSGPGIHLRGKVTNRRVHGQPIVGGSHRVLNNVLVDHNTPVLARGPQSTLSGNLTEKVTAAFDVKTLRLTWRLKGAIPQCESVKAVTHDFWSRPRRAGQVWPGPFGKPPAEPTTVNLRPDSGPDPLPADAGE